MGEISPRAQVIHYLMRMIDYGKGTPDPEIDGLTLGDLADRVIALVTPQVAPCDSVSEVKPFGSDAPLRCLLVAPHPLYRHYAAFPGDPKRFWTWEDKDR